MGYIACRVSCLQNVQRYLELMLFVKASFYIFQLGVCYHLDQIFTEGIIFHC